MPDTIGYICMHTWPRIGTTEGATQLIPPAVPKGVVFVHQQLCTGHKQWYVHPTLGQSGCSWERTCSSFTVWLIHLPQLPKLVGLVHNLGQPAHPEVVNQRPILGYIGSSQYGYCTLTGLTKPWPIMQMCAAELSSTVLGVTMVAPVAKYHGGQIIVLPAPCTWPVVQWQHVPSKLVHFMPTKGLPQTKGTISDQVDRIHGLICWIR